MKRIHFILLLSIMLLLLFQVTLYSQEMKVKNVSFEQEKEKIIITYDLFGSFKNKYSVTLSLSEDGGITFPIKPRTVHGDVGIDITPGLQKQVVWDFMQDFPTGLEGNEFVFVVEAEVLEHYNGFLSFIKVMFTFLIFTVLIYYMSSGDRK